MNGRSSNRKPRDAHAVTPPAKGRLRALARKPAAWVGAIVLGALAVQLTDASSGVIESWLPVADLVDKLSSGGPVRAVALEGAPGPSWWVLPRSGVDPAEITFKGLGDYSTLNRLGAADVSRTFSSLILTGNRHRPVSVENILISVKRCAAPLDGDLMEHGYQGGAEEKIYLSADLDARNPVLVDNSGKPYFTGPKARRLVLAKDASQSLLLNVTTTRRYCEWTIIVEYFADGEPHRLEVMNRGGRPFRTSAVLPKGRAYTGTVLVTDPSLSAYMKTPLKRYCADPLAATSEICSRRPQLK
ncbi:hypothetical protein [Sphaerisporangium corydalis]|uniref:Uncharacterized protein n=1 Tax=Sphaerisporangium corydalis TaxID=1441875 RepID=A0ABV9E968_9ACTN|nr:hypothetical protein [Sphaerisporangium corydalis]